MDRAVRRAATLARPGDVVLLAPAAASMDQFRDYAARGAAFAAAVAAHDPVRIGGEIKAPAKIRDVKPEYPAEARGAGVQGVVIVEVLVGPDGDVLDAWALRSIPLLDEAALDAVRQWHFTPTIVDGVPRSALITVTVNFTLQ